MIVGVLVSVTYFSGCETNLRPPEAAAVVSQQPLPHYRVTSDIREPVIDDHGQPGYIHWLVCELDNGAWFRLSIKDDPLTPEMIDEAVRKYLARRRR